MAGARIIREGFDPNGIQDVQFKRQKYDQFSNENQMFANLRGTDGMVEYIGWFKSYELDATGNQESFWNIVLELADFDLYTAMRKESPPISSEEIAGFWDSLTEIVNTLASIHTVCIDSHEYLT
ncbi:Protein kinase domain-containing protein [Colletotrichum sp. SAR 10_65]|nr:Protein kinase domain-containing protein [Colletotrichum sp. SAR 10_65]